MDLIDRYLAAVGFLLPREQRADITAELRDALETRAEEKQAEVGRALSVGEESELLRAFGHPLAVAARYGRRQYLIGPEIYPLYAIAVKVLIAVMAVIALVVAAVAEAIHPGDWGAAVRAALGAFWHGAVPTIATVTIAAAIFERYNIPLEFLSHWNPGDLPRSPRRPLLRPQTGFEHAAGILVQTVFILWWIHVLPIGVAYLTYIPLSAGQHLDLTTAQIWRTLFWPVLGLAVTAVVLHVLMLAGQSRRAWVRALTPGEHVALAAIAVVALRSGHWVDVSGAGIASATLAKVGFGVNIGFQAGLIVSIAVSASLAALDAWRLYSNGRARPETIRAPGRRPRAR